MQPDVIHPSVHPLFHYSRYENANPVHLQNITVSSSFTLNWLFISRPIGYLNSLAEPMVGACHNFIKIRGTQYDANVLADLLKNPIGLVQKCTTKTEEIIPDFVL